MTDPQLDHELNTEPALTIGEIFASKAMVRTYVAAAAGIVAGLFKLVIDDAMIDNISTLVMLAFLAGSAIMAKIEQAKLARQQASETREHVYAPATVEKIVEAQSRVKA